MNIQKSGSSKPSNKSSSTCRSPQTASMCEPPKIVLEVGSFGTLNCKPVTKFVWASSNNVEVEVINYGATITRMCVPDRWNKAADIVMGYDDMNGYTSVNNPYFGATVGRVANRIGSASFKIDGHQYNVGKNIGQHSLHGGFKGFDKVLWDYTIKDDTKVVLSYLSPDGEEGYPGNVLVSITFELTLEDEFKVDMQATTSKKTPINLTNHSYFNLAGHDSGFKEVLNHMVEIKAASITETDQYCIPTGKLLKVCGTPFDFRSCKWLADAFEEKPEGFDDNFCIDPPRCDFDIVRLTAKAVHPGNGRYLEVYSNQNGCQFYTANFLPNVSENVPAKLVIGKGNTKYEKCGSFCFETQNFPDAVNHCNFPNAVICPGEIYQHFLVYKFGIVDDNDLAKMNS